MTYEEYLRQLRLKNPQEQERLLSFRDSAFQERARVDLEVNQQQQRAGGSSWWQKPFEWMNTAAEVSGAVLSSPFTKSQPGMDTSGMNWLERERQEYRATDMPSVGLGFNYPSWMGGGEASLGVKGALEQAPFMLPMATPFKGASLLARLGGVTKAAAGLGKVAGAVGAVERVPMTVAGKLFNIPKHLIDEGLIGKQVGWLTGREGRIKMAGEAPEALKRAGMHLKTSADPVRSAKGKIVEEGLFEQKKAGIHLEKGKRVGEIRYSGPSIDNDFKAYIKAKSALKGKYDAPSFSPLDDFTNSDLGQSYRYLTKFFGEGEEFQALRAADAIEQISKGILPEPNQAKLLGEVLGDEFLVDYLKKKGFGTGAVDLIEDIANFPRAVLASFDMSFPFRQGWFFQAGHWKESMQAFPAMIKAFAKKETAVAVMDAIEQHPKALLARKAGLDLTSIIGKGVAREESFISKFANWFPGSKQSQQAFTTYGNKLRFDVFTNVTNFWESQGVKASMNDYNQLAKLINLGTGRGSLGPLEKYTTVLNMITFSPKLQAANIQIPFMAFSSSPLVRQEFAKNGLRMVGVGATLLGILNASGLATVETNPLSADWGKVKIGNTRIDIWGGKQQYARLIANLVTGYNKASGGGKAYKTDRLQTALRFAQGKASPAFGFAVDWIKGETFLGDPMEFKTATGVGKQARERMVPMFIQDVWDMLEEDNLTTAVSVAPLAFFGTGIASYGKGTWQEVRQLRERHNDTGTPYDDLDKADKRKIDATPQIKDLTDKLYDDMRQYPGSDTEKAIKVLEVSREDEFKVDIEAIAQRMKDGRMTWGQYNDERKRMLTTRYAVKGFVYDMQNIFTEETPEELERNIRDSLTPKDLAMMDYKMIFGDPIIGDDGGIDWDETFEKAEKFLQSKSSDMRTYIIANKDAWINELDPKTQGVERERLRLTNVLEPYWEVPGEVKSSLTDYQRKRLEEYTLARRVNGAEWGKLELQRDLGLAYLVRNVMGQIGQRRDAMRQLDPNLDQAISVWYLRDLF